MGAKVKKVLQLDKNKNYQVVEAKESEVKKEIQMFSLGMATEIGYSIAVPIVVGAFVGVFLDGKFGTKPKFTLSGIFFGIFLSFVNLFKIVQNIITKSKS